MLSKMPEDYKKVVLAYYEEKVNGGNISPNLLDATPGSLREECILIYRKRHSTKDDEIINSFFSNVDPKNGSFSLLENSFAVKFKQMPKILKGKVKNPGIKYIELLAWLIDFRPRPSTSYYKSFYTNESFETIIDRNNSEEDNENKTGNRNLIYEDESQTEEKKLDLVSTAIETITSSTDRSKKSKLGNLKKRTTIITLIFMIAASIGVYTIFPTTSQCMYWTGNNYKTTGCDIIIGDTPIIALNKYKLTHLKRITKPDTLTLKDIGKAWYTKITLDSAEFYTDSGEYPLDTKKKLRPASKFIIEKYVLRK